MEYTEIIKELKSLSSPENVAGMARFGITPKKAYGVTVPHLRRIAKAAGRDRALAQRLWSNDTRETRILAGMIDEPALVDSAQMDAWAAEFTYWEICDGCCMNLFEKTPLAWEKAVEWSRAEREGVKRAGFVLMARLAVSDKKAEDAKFEKFLPIIKRESGDGRNDVKKGINWALRQIGKRNLSLNAKAIAVGKEIRALGTKSAKWIAADALRELESDAVQKRLRAKKK
jgi:3-methyladenine DNA glycosylase AlkD